MFDDATSDYKGIENNDSKHLLLSSISHIRNIKTQQPNQLEPCFRTDDSCEDLSTFDKSVQFHVPVLSMREPIILLERCDKIWETLKLIKNIQEPDIIDITDFGNEEKEEQNHFNESKQSITNIKHQSTLSSNNSSAPPLQFSVQKTRKVFPCVICGKHYMEKRSLRHHSARIHGVIIPLDRAYIRRIPRLPINKKDYKKNNTTASISTGSAGSNLEKFENNKSMYSEAISVAPTKYSTTNSLNKTSKADVSNTNSNADTSKKNKIKLLPAKRKRVGYRPPCYERYICCVLCKRRVASLEKHLTQYHKVGCPKRVMKYLQSAQALASPASAPSPTPTPLSLPTKNGEPSEERKKLKNILSGRIPECPVSINSEIRDKSYIADREKKSHEISQAKTKRKHTFSYAMTQKSASNITSYKCEICLGIYASLNSLQKHRRRHRMRGETKENFSRFKCRYHNSPLNKKYQLSKSSLNLNNTIVENTKNNKNRDLHLKNSKEHTLFNENNKGSKINRLTKYFRHINKNDETVCICGRTFRNSHNLYMHKRQCKICKQEDAQSTAVNGDDKNSDAAINITIKKRNDSYEIVGKNNDESSCNELDICVNNDLSLNSNSAYRECINTTTKKSELSGKSLKNNQNHNILKIEVIDDDDIIDIENDSEFNNIQDEEQYSVTQVNNTTCLKKQQNKIENMENKKTFCSVRTLKEICQDILNRNTSESENSVISQENIRMLRSSLKREDCNFCN